MKKNILILTVTSLMAGYLLTNCSKEHKVEKAEENVVEAQNDLSKAEQKLAEEWQKFKAESEDRIRNNENDIALYREMEKTDKRFSDRYKNKIDELEIRNTELKDKINNYDNDKVKNNWNDFKTEFNHDMDQLGQALKDLAVKNTK